VTTFAGRFDAIVLGTGIVVIAVDLFTFVVFVVIVIVMEVRIADHPGVNVLLELGSWVNTFRNTGTGRQRYVDRHVVLFNTGPTIGSYVESNIVRSSFFA